MWIIRFCLWILAGWWFGTFSIFPSIGNFIIPTDELISFQRGGSTTNQLKIYRIEMMIFHLQYFKNGGYLWILNIYLIVFFPLSNRDILVRPGLASPSLAPWREWSPALRSESWDGWCLPMIIPEVCISTPRWWMICLYLTYLDFLKSDYQHHSG